MSKIFKNMIPYWKIVIAIIGLLVVQAWCDLSLPSYTSDIIDVGIQNHGVEHVMPEKIQEERRHKGVEKFVAGQIRGVRRTACAAADYELSNERHGGENLRKNGGEPDGIRKQK